MRILLNALLVGAVLFAACGSAASTTSHSDAPNSQAVLLPHLLAQGDFALARAVLRRAVAGQPSADLDMAHLEGLILERQGRYEEAIRKFRAILTRAPNFLPSRVELAKALYLTGQTEIADHYFEAIELGTEDAGLKRLAQSFRTRIRADRLYGASGYIAVLPSTNINKGTYNGVFMVGGVPFRIADQSRAASGIGVGVGGEAYRAWHAGPQTTYTISAALDLKKYTGTDDYDQLTLTANPTMQRQYGSTLLRFGPLVQYEWAAWEPYLLRYGFSGTAARPLSRRSVLTANVTVLEQDYAAAYDYNDGWLASGSASLRYFLSPAFSVSLRGTVTAERTQRDDLDHNDYRIQLQADREWRGGLLTTVFVAAEEHHYLGKFPLTSITRHDTEIDVGGSVAFRSVSLAGFAPQLTYQYTDQRSNITFYDYHSHDLGIALIRDF